MLYIIFFKKTDAKLNIILTDVQGHHPDLTLQNPNFNRNPKHKLRGSDLNYYIALRACIAVTGVEEIFCLGGGLLSPSTRSKLIHLLLFYEGCP